MAHDAQRMRDEMYARQATEAAIEAAPNVTKIKSPKPQRSCARPAQGANGLPKPAAKKGVKLLEKNKSGGRGGIRTHGRR
jgi:hypothetical protein